MTDLVTNWQTELTPKPKQNQAFNISAFNSKGNRKDGNCFAKLMQTDINAIVNTVWVYSAQDAILRWTDTSFFIAA